jgi:hypothetical protein
MAQETILLPDEFDVSKVTYSTPRVMKNGAKVVYVGYKGEKLLFQTPVCVSPFGINKWQNEDGSGPVKYSIDFSFQGMEQRPALKRFFDNLNNLDAKLIQDGFANHDKWLSLKKAPKSVDDVENVYTRIVKMPKDPKYSPTFKVNLPHDGSRFTFDVYDAKQNMINLFDMVERKEIETKRCRVWAIIQCTGIWVAGGKSYGCSWKVLQMEITPPASIKGYALRKIKDDVVPDVDDEEEEGTTTTRTPAGSSKRDPEDESVEESDDDAADEVVTVGNTTQASDDDEEVVESEDELDEKPVVATPPPKKTTVKKK